MLNVSQAWQDASIKQFRYPAYLAVSVEVTPPGLREDTIVSASSTDAVSSADAMIDGIYTATKYATLELNRWALDGSFDVLSDDGTTGIWQSEMTFPVTITFTFGAVYSVPGAFVVWDVVENSCPSSVTMTGYGQDGTVKATKTFTGLTESKTFLELAMNDVASVVLSIASWNHTDWRARIVEILFGLYMSFDNSQDGRLSSATMQDQISPIASELPKHTIDVTFKNYDMYFDPSLKTGISPYLAKRQQAKATWSFETSPGVKETAPSTAYLVSGFDIPKSSSDVTMHCGSQLDFLTEVFTKGTYSASVRTLKDIAQYVLQSSDLITDTDEETPWILPTVLDTFTTTAPIPAIATNQLLQYIASASGLRLCTDATTGYITFKSVATTALDDCPLDKNTVYGEPQVKVTDRLKSIDISIYKYTPKTVTQQIAQMEYTLSTTKTVLVKYNVPYATEVSFTISGGTLSKANYYASYAELTLVPSGTNTLVTVTGTGKEVTSEMSYVRIYEDTEVTNGLVVKIDNPFVTSYALASVASANVQEYYNRRTKYTMDYMGLVQLEGSDVVDMSSTYGDSVVEVTDNTVEFNGGWSGIVSCY